jgi:methionyl-tRNA formyltransferase
MNIVFFGTSEFAIPSLRLLLNSRHKILAVVTQPDRAKGRHLKVAPPPTKVLASSKGVAVFQPRRASDADFVERLKGLKADLFVVVSFGQILKRGLLDLPRLRPINLHGSLLPKYRGASPVNWAVINGETKTGVTIIAMNEKMDAGDIMLKKEVTVDDADTSQTLNDKLSDMGAGLLLEAVELLERGKATFAKQDDSLASYAPKLKKEDGLIDWSKGAFAIHNLARGLLPWPGAFTRFKGKILKVLETETAGAVSAKGTGAGEVLSTAEDKGITVMTGSGAIVLKRVQLEGKKPLDAVSFVRGQRIEKGFRFA